MKTRAEAYQRMMQQLDGWGSPGIRDRQQRVDNAVCNLLKVLESVSAGCEPIVNTAIVKISREMLMVRAGLRSSDDELKHRKEQAEKLGKLFDKFVPPDGRESVPGPETNRMSDELKNFAHKHHVEVCLCGKCAMDRLTRDLR